MNVFILDKNMEKSAQYLDDEHLKAQINEACQVLMANWNHENYPDAKIGHINHPVTNYYNNVYEKTSLYKYLFFLLNEYRFRFGKIHQNYFWYLGFWGVIQHDYNTHSVYLKTYVNGSMTDDIEAIRHYIMTKPHTRPFTWTNREKPDWWEV